MTYYKTNTEMYKSKLKTGEWVSVKQPVYWNVMQAMAIVKTKTGAEYKLVITDFYKQT